MNGPFGAIRTAASGASMASAWMDTIGHNLANANTVTSTDGEPFRAKYLVVQERAGAGGVELREVVSASGEAPLIYDPTHPLADEDGLVQGAMMDTVGTMSDMIIASRHYQLNLQVVKAAEEAYQSALEIGR